MKRSPVWLFLVVSAACVAMTAVHPSADATVPGASDRAATPLELYTQPCAQAAPAAQS